MQLVGRWMNKQKNKITLYKDVKSPKYYFFSYSFCFLFNILLATEEVQAWPYQIAFLVNPLNMLCYHSIDASIEYFKLNVIN